MLRLVSSVVLVLLVWEAEAQLHEDEIYPCRFVAGDPYSPNLKELRRKYYTIRNVEYHDIKREYVFPGHTGSFKRPITFIEVDDYTCLTTNNPRNNLAQITGGGVGERHVSIKFSIPEQSVYEFSVVIHG